MKNIPPKRKGPSQTNTGAMQNVPRILPWQSWQEWNQVFEALFHQDPNHQAAAVRRISTWRIRGRCPHAVDSSAQLIETRMNDFSICSGNTTSLSDQSLRTAYSMCIVRAVNGIVDGGQKGTQATSIQKLARKVGLPVWVVELRHDATHNNMPHLPLLRLAVDTILDWFYNKYWIAQSKFLNDIRSLCAGILRRYERGGRGDGHRAGIDDQGLRSSLSIIPNSTLASMLIPILFEENSNPNNTNNEQNDFMTLTGLMSKNVDGSLLIPNSIRYPPSKVGVQSLYFKLLPLFEALHAQWSGFSECLFTQLIEEILILYSNANHLKDNEKENDDSNTKDIDENDMTKFQRHEFFLLSWLELLLSRDWFCRLLDCPLEISSDETVVAKLKKEPKEDDEDQEDDRSFLKFDDPSPVKSSSPSPLNQSEELSHLISTFKEDQTSSNSSGLYRKPLYLSTIPFTNWTSEQRQFMLSQCPLSSFLEQGVLSLTVPSSFSSSPSVSSSSSSSMASFETVGDIQQRLQNTVILGGNTCVGARLLRRAVWVLLKGKLDKTNIKLEKLLKILTTPFNCLITDQSAPFIHQTSESTHLKSMNNSTSKSNKKKRKLVSSDNSNASEITPNETCHQKSESEVGSHWDLVIDWVPCSIGTYPDTLCCSLDVSVS